MSTHTKIYGLLTTPILHTILIPRKKEKEKNNQTHQQRSPNVCNQRHLKTSVEITSKSKNENNKKQKNKTKTPKNKKRKK